MFLRTGEGGGADRGGGSVEWQAGIRAQRKQHPPQSKLSETRPQVGPFSQGGEDTVQVQREASTVFFCTLLHNLTLYLKQEQTISITSRAK